MGFELVLDVGAVAHGGHCVARIPQGSDGADGMAGRVVFVRHALPGERVRVRLTDAPAKASFWRGDAVEVLEASPDRVETHPWPAAGPGGVGGAELAHVALTAQRAWKAQVVAEQLRRLAGIEREVVVEAAPGDDERGGLGWRTRIGLVADAGGRAGMRAHRSHEVQALADMPLASDRVRGLDLFTRRWPAGALIEVVAPAGGDEPVVLVDGRPWDLRRSRPDERTTARRSVRETVTTSDGVVHSYRVRAAGFWQVHREAPGVLVDAVLAAARPALAGVARPRVVDLYSGAGLFTVPLAGLVGPDGEVVAVEGDAAAVRDARRNVHDLGQVRLVEGDVRRVLEEPADHAGGDGAQGPVASLGSADVVVLDPPRTGAGKQVVAAIAARGPRRVVYVACDPAALARDLSYLAGHGYALVELRAFDLFPHTHHVECVAVLERGEPHILTSR